MLPKLAWLMWFQLACIMVACSTLDIVSLVAIKQLAATFIGNHHER
jgi:hypothetical protein